MQFSIPNPFGPPTVIDSATMAPNEFRPYETPAQNFRDAALGTPSQASPLMQSPVQPSMPNVPSGPNPLDLLAGQANGERQQGYDMLRQAAQNAPVPQSTMPRPGLLGLVTLASLLGNDASRFDRSYDPLGRFTGAFAQARQEANQNAQQQYAPKLQAAQIGAQEHFNAAQQAQQALTQGRLFEQQQHMQDLKDQAAEDRAKTKAAEQEKLDAVKQYNQNYQKDLNMLGQLPPELYHQYFVGRQQIVDNYFGGKDPGGSLAYAFPGQTAKSKFQDLQGAFIQAKTKERLDKLGPQVANILANTQKTLASAKSTTANVASMIKTREGQLKATQENADSNRMNAITNRGRLGIAQQQANTSAGQLAERKREFNLKPGTNIYAPSKIETAQQGNINKLTQTQSALSQAIDQAKSDGWDKPDSLMNKQYLQDIHDQAEVNGELQAAKSQFPRYQKLTRVEWIEAQNAAIKAGKDPAIVAKITNDALRHLAASAP